MNLLRRVALHFLSNYTGSKGEDAYKWFFPDVINATLFKMMSIWHYLADVKPTKFKGKILRSFQRNVCIMMRNNNSNTTYEQTKCNTRVGKLFCKVLFNFSHFIICKPSFHFVLFSVPFEYFLALLYYLLKIIEIYYFS